MTLRANAYAENEGSRYIPAMLRAAAVFALVPWLACGGQCPRPVARSAPATTPPKPAAEPAGPHAPADLERWRAIKAASGQLADGATPAGELAGLVELLGAVDPEARDALGYEIVVMWVGDEAMLDADGVRELTGLLRPRLRTGIEQGESDASYGRSFAALALSVVAARDVAVPTLPDDELFALVDDLAWYASSEVDLRGYTGQNGWLHAAAHTADALKFLARNQRITGDRTVQILDAVASLVTRRHGYLLYHGEDARLAAPVLELLDRDAIDTSQFEAWVATLIEPLTQPSDHYEPALYAAQRNARNLLFTLVVRFELREHRSPGLDRAREVLLRALRGA